MKKILLPLEETERSLKALHYARKHFAIDDAEFVLMMVDESLSYSARSEAEAAALRELDEKLDLMAAALDGYRVTKISAVGKAGLRITRTARERGADMIIMTKSSKADMLNSIGSTAEYVLNNAPCDVLIVSEAVNRRNEYRGLIYRTAKGNVTLRGQLGDKQSECLLPSVNQDCLYHIDVTVGRVKFYHTSYNPDTRSWDQPPLPGQEVTTDVATGESKYILVKADSTDGKADRIRIVNRDMKKEAVFSFEILAAKYDEDGRLRIPGETAQEPESSAAAPAAPAATDPEKAMATRDTIEMPKIEPEPDIPENFEAPEVPTFEMDPDAAADSRTEAVTEKKPAPLFGKLFGKDKGSREVPVIADLADPVPAPTAEVMSEAAAEIAETPAPTAEAEIPAPVVVEEEPKAEVSAAPAEEAAPAPAVTEEEPAAPPAEAEIPAPVVIEEEPATEPAPAAEEMPALAPVVIEEEPAVPAQAVQEVPAPAPAAVVVEETAVPEPQKEEDQDSGAVFSVEIRP